MTATAANKNMNHCASIMSCASESAGQRLRYTDDVSAQHCPPGMSI